MSGPADFEAYKRYLQIGEHQPVEVIQSGLADVKSYVQVDFNGFRNLDQKSTDRLVDKFARAANDGRYDGDVVNDIRLDIADAQAGKRILFEKSGAVNHSSQNVILIDAKTVSYRQFAADITMRPLTAIDAPQEKLLSVFTREHETAHQMLGLEEAGADYMASKRLLELYPGKETENFLQQLSDLRMMGPYRASTDHIGDAMRYGYGCSEAITSALSQARQGENLSLEESYQMAKDFDAHNGKNFKVVAEGYKGSVRPEMVVRTALLEIDSSLDDNVYSAGSLASAADKLLQSGKFSSGSKMNNILEDLSAASKRIDRALENAPPFEKPALSQTPAPAMAAGLS